ncbi:MAG: metallophosphoesterase [Clostridiales bacterium]|nr:metallophosphoesterase [Clostridiales bacterium]
MESTKKMQKKKKSPFRAFLKGVGLFVLTVILLGAVFTTAVTLVQNEAAYRQNEKTVEPFKPSLLTTNGKVGSPGDAPLEIYVMNDIHILATDEHTEGPMDRAESEAIMTASFKRAAEDETARAVILPGDLTHAGDRDSYAILERGLQTLKDAGKDVYALPAGHDFKDNGNPNVLSRDEASEKYMSFLTDGVVLEYSPFDGGKSYVAQISENYRLLVINADHIFGRGYEEEELAWVLKVISDSRLAGDYIFAMQHYPVLNPSPLYSYTGSKDWHEWHLNAAGKMADAGLEFIFTGHSHVHSVVNYKTALGNTLYNVGTGTLTGSPGFFRKVRFSYDEVKIESLALTAEELAEVGIDTAGRNGSEYMRAEFAKMVTDMVYCAAADDMETFAAHCHEFGIGLSREKLEKDDKKLWKIISAAGKAVDKIKIKDVKALILYAGKLDKDFEERYLKDFAAELITGISYGNMSYKPGTSEYLFAALLVERARPIVNMIDKSGKTMRTVETLRDALLYKDGGPDDLNPILPRLN